MLMFSVKVVGTMFVLNKILQEGSWFDAVVNGYGDVIQVSRKWCCDL